MLDRVLEPEVMDTEEEAREYDAMDHATVNRAFVTDFLAACPEPGLVLDVGAGTAQIPIELARRYAGCRVVAIDLSEWMIRLGRDNVARAGLTDRIELRRVDAKSRAEAIDQFDAVMSNSIVHHIPSPGMVFREMVAACRPGGTIFVRDLKRPGDAAELRRLVDLHAAGATPKQRSLFADSLHAALTVDEVRAIVVALGFKASSVAATSDRHWTWSVRTAE